MRFHFAQERGKLQAAVKPIGYVRLPQSAGICGQNDPQLLKDPVPWSPI
jgi:hypothetical protein